MVRYRYKVSLETKTDIMNFVMIAESLAGKSIEVLLENEDGTKHGNASTLLNVCETISWNDVYIVSSVDVYMLFQKFIIN